MVQVSPADTWWGILLDGLAGAVLGGGVTAWAVLYTLRREKRRDRHQVLDETISRLGFEAMYLFQFVAQGQMKSTQGVDAYGRFIANATEAVARLSAEEPALSEVLKQLAARIVVQATKCESAGWRSVELNSELAALLTTMNGAVGRWHVSPKDFANGKATADSLLKATRPKANDATPPPSP